jgi:transmembrane sensor
MTSKDEQIRAAIVDQAAEWLVANDEKPLAAAESAALAAWLKASPVHVEEFLGVSVVARDLREAAADAEYSVDTVVARARAEDDAPVQRLWPRLITPARSVSSRAWLTVAAATMAAIVLVSLGIRSLWEVRPGVAVLVGTTALHFETRHGEQLTRRLADNSVLHLNTDSAVTIRFGRTERLVMLTSGQADFEVAHEPNRAFRVFAGTAEVVAIGTQFDVRLQDDSTVVTVIEGRVAVRPSPVSETRRANTNHAPRYVEVGADQQIRVAADEWPVAPTTVDTLRSTAWLRHEIMFDHEPLERVAADFNRYATKRIEIATPALRNLEITGAFATGDTEAFIAFLRSLQGVRVEVTATDVRVSQQ